MEQSRPPDTLADARTMRRTGVAIAVLALLVVAWTFFSSRLAAQKLKEHTEVQSVVSVSTVKPAPLTDTPLLTLPGNVQANTDAPIYARTNGYLRRWLVDIGAHVKAGDVLAEIDAPELDQQLRGAEAELATAQANQKIAGTTAERWRGLRDTDSVSKQEADEKLSIADSSAAQLRAAQANLQRLRELSGFKKIVAPFDGVVTARNTDVGQLISGGGAGPELFRIADMRQLRLYVRVPQAYAAAMQPGLMAEVRFPDRPGRSYPAQLERTANALDAVSRTLLAQLVVDNAKGELLPGAYAEVRFQIPPDAAAAAFKLPANVLLANGEGLQVATVNAQGHVEMKDVLVGRDFGSDIEIVGGLDPAADVILSPPDSLTAETAVRVTQPKAAAAASP
ncbi:MAG TPA: efflux RND transporter periplasmic adaptor subunit [Steroidobacteraceae bacterium]|jgi:RND family efflux transporter MFP subunit|nr:efflux RND transporter periplasmic adaptor subunit [Steroidobacteraceae bacterium]